MTKLVSDEKLQQLQGSPLETVRDLSSELTTLRALAAATKAYFDLRGGMPSPKLAHDRKHELLRQLEAYYGNVDESGAPMARFFESASPELSNAALAAIIREEVAKVAAGGLEALGRAASRFRDLGVVANMHVGRGAEMAPGQPGAQRLMLEWYAGSLVAVEEKGAHEAVNSWLNCVDKFTADYEGRGQ